MRQARSMILVILLIMSVSTIVFAAEPGDSENIDVTGKYNSIVNESTVYSVDIVWDNMTFTYNEVTEKVWNAANHSYSTTTNGEWDKTTANITVTNHSNATVNVALAYDAVADTGISGVLSATQKTLSAGVEGKPDEADSLVATLTISGEPTEVVTDDGVKIGSVTITLS